VVICLERGADLQMAQLMPLPLTVCCFCRIQIGFTFLVPAYPGSPGKKAVKRVCVCDVELEWKCFVTEMSACGSGRYGRMDLLFNAGRLRLRRVTHQLRQGSLLYSIFNPIQH